MARTQNALFNSKTVSKLIESISISEEQKIAANEWLELLEKDKLKDEKSNYLFFWDIILIRLLNFPKLTTQYEKENVEFQFPDETGKNIVCFEVKGTSTEDLFSSQHRVKKEHATPIKQTWDYMGKNNLDYGICTNYRSFVLIKKTEGYSKYHYFDFKNIRDNDEKLKEFVAIFSKSSIIETPTIKNLYEDSIIAEQDFTEEFYKLFHETRLMLKKEFEECGFSNQEAIKYTQLFLNRLIFTFFVEDNGNIPNRLFSDRIFGILNTDQIT